MTALVTALRSFARHFSAAAAALLVAASPFMAAPAVGQVPDIRHTSYTGIGYSANLPGVMTGIGAFHLMPNRGFGVFANGHLTLRAPDDGPAFIPGRTPSEAREAGDRHQQEQEAYLSLSAGVIRAFDPEMALYAGIGYTRERILEEFFDPMEQMGDFGYYWVEDGARTTEGLNVTAGLFIQGGRNLFFRVGGELFPLGGSLGVYWAIPR